MRAFVVTLGVLLSVAAVVFGAAAVSLFVDGEGGAGGFATFVTLVCLLCAVLLFRASPRRAAPRQRRQSRADGGFYYGDSTPSYGYVAGSAVGDDRRWGGDSGADSGSGHHGSGHHGSGHHGSGHHGSGHHGSGHSGGWGGSDAGADGGSSGSDGGGGGSDGGGGGGGD